MAKKKQRSKKSNQLKGNLRIEVTGIILIALSLISIIHLGAVGKAIDLFFRFFLGEWYMIALVGVICLAVYLMVRREWPFFFSRRLNGLYIMLSSLLLMSHVKLFEMLTKEGQLKNASVITNTWEQFSREVKGETSTPDMGGGMIGAILFAVSHFLFDSLGTKFLCIVLIVIGFVLITGKSIGSFFEKAMEKVKAFIRSQWQASKRDLSEWKSDRIEKKKERRVKTSEQEQRAPEVSDVPSVEADEVIKPLISSFTEKAYGSRIEEEDPKVKGASPEEKTENPEEKDDVLTQSISFSEPENEAYQLPSLSLLKRPKSADQSNEYKLIHANAAKLERTFQSFGVKARVTQVHLGPAVTKYEVNPDVGVKVSKIVSLSDDLALALAAKDIRMEAPIPGKSAIGIEVPNSEIAVVALREVLESNEQNKPDSKLQIGLGRDITGQAVLAELNKMPHLLVAGATGSGKSVCINGIITSILMRAKPHEVKLMMVDPKMVELNVYNGVPHLLAPVVTNPKKASQALQKVVSEMERRYELFSHTGTRNIEGYNEYVKRENLASGEKHPQLPYIVVIVDELADLMMVASNDVEDSITRLAQMARAAGIHLIIATQRPSVDVITGVIKANIPSRIAFAVSSATDSRTILDMGGAEKLLGRGDMLFLPVGASKPIRVQGAFLSDEEVEDVVNFVISQQKAQYQEEMIPDDIPETTAEVDDELYEDAVQLIAEMQTASVSMLQRRFRVGYTRAARLIDEMELRGVVGPYEGSKPRTVLVPKPSEEQSS
jgi:S-DNA-T family DNA segregation ATPase FtsK/SpoIIIE